jgi:hypothetical protein
VSSLKGLGVEFVPLPRTYVRGLFLASLRDLLPVSFTADVEKFGRRVLFVEA